jgi:hydrogenase/urease accessory protein HupE
VNAMRHFWLALLVLMGAGYVSCCAAHETRPATLEIKELTANHYDVVWRTPVNAGMRLPLLLELPKDAKNLTAPTTLELTDSLLERRSIEVPGSLDGKRINFIGLQATITDVVVRVQLLDGRSWSTIVRPSQAWIDIAANPGGLSIATTYLVHGIRHILFGPDHLLFILGLLLIVKDRWSLLKTITAFTLAHSITLAIATLGYAQAPTLPLNAAIALSILFLGPEIVKTWRGESSFTIRHPWVVAFAFGLLHGFGFASALASAGLPRNELAWALVSFNVGVEIGQVGFVALILLLERAYRTLQIHWPRPVALLPGFTVGSLGAFWTVQRVAMMMGWIR